MSLRLQGCPCDPVECCKLPLLLGPPDPSRFVFFIPPIACNSLLLQFILSSTPPEEGLVSIFSPRWTQLSQCPACRGSSTTVVVSGQWDTPPSAIVSFLPFSFPYGW